MIIYTIDENSKLDKLFLGNDISKNQKPFILFKKGTIFGGENIDKSSYTLLTCLTIPKFKYEGFKIIRKEDVNVQIEGRFFKQ